LGVGDISAWWMALEVVLVGEALATLDAWFLRVMGIDGVMGLSWTEFWFLFVCVCFFCMVGGNANREEVENKSKG
jgi:hypothetical protein